MSDPTHPKQRYNILTLLTILLSWYSSPGQTKPNVVLIFADDMGYGDLSVYGNPFWKTPVLDRMAQGGFHAKTFYVPNPTCSPSRAALLTGRYPVHSGIPYPLGPGSDLGLPDSAVTMAEYLHTAGYATHMIGKWHLGDKSAFHHPIAQGFDGYYGMLYSHDYKFPYVQTDTTLAAYRDRKKEWIQPDDSLLVRKYTDEALTYIRKKAASKKPFFLYLAHQLPHVPLATRKIYQGKSGSNVYGDVIREIDESVGEIWKEIQRLGIEKNTLIIFTSDNGPWYPLPDRILADGHSRAWDVGFAGFFRGAKGSTYEGGHREPFIAYWKGKIPANSQSSEPLSSMDLLPTLLHLAGIEPPKKFKLDGQNIFPIFNGTKKVLAERPLYYDLGNRAEAVRLGAWKLRVAPPSNVDELYNLVLDPAERFNLAQANPEKVIELRKLLHAYPGNMPDK